MILQLFREYFPTGTNGRLYINGRFVCFTIELPWLNNAKRLSCIPEGNYRVRPRYSAKFKTHLLVEGVRARDLILVHPANDAQKELRGCIAPVSALTGPGTGLKSRQAFVKLLEPVLEAVDDGPVFIHIQKQTS